MLRALGFSQSDFDCTDPGRLCRGRERWIDSFPRDDSPFLSRVTLSGATFSDDSARDARRGLRFSGLSAGRVLRALWPDAVLIAWCEEGHPRFVPAAAEGCEYYTTREAGGQLRAWHARWSMVCRTEDEVSAAMDGGADVFLVRDDLPAPASEGPRPIVDAPLADAYLDPPHQGGLPEELRALLFLLTGHRVSGSPARSFQAAAIPEVLGACAALVLLHQDKHGAALGIYSVDPVPGVDPLLTGLAREVGALPVPFAIPPMLARWDRALWELRQDWDEATQGEYPVPPADDASSGWSRRGPSPRPAPPAAEE
ncbi:MAG: hypothetical protein RL071_2003 [Pseudomonadota bacterium]|jgi:hypothetical protein